jgi:hypothetical protein
MSESAKPRIDAGASPMVWVEGDVEFPPWMNFLAGLTFVVMVAVWCFLDTGACALVYAIFSIFPLTFVLVNFLRQFGVLSPLPPEARQAAQIVLAWFRKRFPEESVKSIAVRAIEPARYVISIRHGLGRPTPRRYFAITRPDLTDITELPRAEWWPRGLK